IMTRLWTEPSVSFDGRFYHLNDATLFPKPINRPIPLFVATGGADAALRRAGRYGGGWFVASTDPAAFREEHQKVLEAARAAGREDAIARVGLYATFHLERDAARAPVEADRHARAYFGAHGNHTQDLIGSPEQIAERLQPLVDEGLTMVVPRFVEQDLPKQSALMREALALLHPRTPAAT